MSSARPAASAAFDICAKRAVRSPAGGYASDTHGSVAASAVTTASVARAPPGRTIPGTLPGRMLLERTLVTSWVEGSIMALRAAP
ncbi:MAG TPA: hypothetical protein VNB06_23245 [Thermoanaerobaculia bacterium]|nr:hypothetical protein [Thermoanaerobaculia bacterium]